MTYNNFIPRNYFAREPHTKLTGTSKDSDFRKEDRYTVLPRHQHRHVFAFLGQAWCASVFWWGVGKGIPPATNQKCVRNQKIEKTDSILSTIKGYTVLLLFNVVFSFVASTTTPDQDTRVHTPNHANNNSLVPPRVATFHWHCRETARAAHTPPRRRI